MTSDLHDTDPGADTSSEPLDMTVARPRSARAPRRAEPARSMEADEAAEPGAESGQTTEAVPGPLRRGGDSPAPDLPAPTSDTVAAHRGSRRRAQAASDAAEDADVDDTASAGAVRPPSLTKPPPPTPYPEGRPALVPDPLAVERYPARSATPIIATRAPRTMAAPQSLIDGASIDRAIRGKARRRAAGVGFVVGGSLLVLGGTFAIVLATFGG